jgi:hypothetical protein
MKARIAVLGAAALLLGGCMGMMYDEWPYRPAGKVYAEWSLIGADVRMPLPPGWMKLNGLSNALVATRDGFNLQTLRFRRIDLEKKLPHTLKVIRKTMRPDEVAEVLLDDLRTDGTALGLQILDTRPAQFAGRPGFRATVLFKDPDGLRYKAVLSGAIIEGYAWQLTYVAAARFYFDRDLPLYERALLDLKID